MNKVIMPPNIYEILVILCILLFAGYDILKKRVPNRALVFFCPVAAMAPIIRIWGSSDATMLLRAAGSSISGAAAAFGIMLLAALLSQNGIGVGGGDIKLAAVIGFIYGLPRISLILIAASFVAAIAAGIIRMSGIKRPLTLPFVPFLAFGSVLATVINESFTPLI